MERRAASNHQVLCAGVGRLERTVRGTCQRCVWTASFQFYPFRFGSSSFHNLPVNLKGALCQLAVANYSSSDGSATRRLYLRIQQSQPRPIKSPRGLSKRSSFRRKSQLVPVELPEDVRVLKQKILETHSVKLIRFSLSHMRHMATPPVLTPDALNDRRAIRTLVSGKTVALTMNMWENCKRKTKHLDMIDEYVTYR